MKIGIIGLGHVGSTVAYTLLLENLVDELVLIDTNLDKLNAEILEMQDVSQNLARNVRISPAPVINDPLGAPGKKTLVEPDYTLLADADFAIFSAADLSRLEMTDRLGELPITSEIVEEVAPKLKDSGFSGVVLSVSNPCDVIAQYLRQQTGFPASKVIGTGTLLDTNRLKNRTGRQDVLMVGEHGESQTAVNQVSDELAQQARLSGWNIFTVKRYTNFGIASCVARILRAMRNDDGEELPISTYDPEADAYYSVLATLGRDGVISRRCPDITETEQIGLDRSVKKIKDVYATR
ncbi:MAG: hypothetical protein FWE28_06100 [Oscillospiraceae bacterium]|nr:hypothetical protein [Oscillospiraceae bacterium]